MDENTAAVLRLRLVVSSSVLILGSGGVYIITRGKSRCAKMSTAKQCAHTIHFMAHQFHDKIIFKAFKGIVLHRITCSGSYCNKE